MVSNFYVTELDSKPIIGGGWENSLEQAKRAARASVTNAPEPTYVAVVGDFDVEFSVARQDHPEAARADEVQVSPEVHISLADFHVGQRVRLVEEVGVIGKGSEGTVVGFKDYRRHEDEHYLVVEFDVFEDADWVLPSEIEAVTA